jgi:hypothetical protein
MRRRRRRRMVVMFQGLCAFLVKCEAEPIVTFGFF